MAILLLENSPWAKSMLLESKRDELLLPYYQLVKDRIPSSRNPGQPLSLGEFKTIMLNKLTNNAFIRNLSLGSNFYLAGATKYYFQGLLTSDNKVGLLSDNISAPENWNRDICRRLNAVILILRNAYVDSIGTKFEQPEDFGELSLPRLLRKYNKQITQILANEPEEEEPKEEEPDNLDRNPQVGNGYTFDIIYNQVDAKKYEEATAPGSWCITYNLGNYNMYIKKFSEYGGIHYVVFLKNGYELIKRPSPPGPGYTREKPHDEYGNSMICYLQRNDCWEPTYITSRWNHGCRDDGTYGTEADYAYDLNEFCQITGVSVDDLKRIYEIWAKDREKYTKAEPKPREITKEVIKAAFISAKRRLSYAQMMMNTSESLKDALTNAGVDLEQSDIYYGVPEKLDNAITKHYIRDDGFLFAFLTDKKKIIFDSLIRVENDTDMGKICWDAAPGVYIVKAKNKCCIYNGRFHEFVNVDGDQYFKKIPLNTGCQCGNRRNKSKLKFIQVKQSKTMVALLDGDTLRPLKLPNGNSYFYKVRGPNIYNDRAEINCHELGSGNGPVIEIWASERQEDRYFFNIETKRFINSPLEDWHDGAFLCVDTDFHGLSGYYLLKYGSWGKHNKFLFNFKDQRVSIYGKDCFDYIDCIYGLIMVGEKNNPNNYWDDVYYRYYDTRNKKFISIENNPIRLKTRRYAIDKSEDERFLFIPMEEYSNFKYVYDTTTGMLVKNTIGYPRTPNGLGFDVWNYTKSMIFKEHFNSYAYRDTLPETLSWGEKEEMVKERRVQCSVSLNDMELEYVPNTCPVNEEFPAQKPQENIPVNEETIRKIVSEVLKNYQ